MFSFLRKKKTTRIPTEADFDVLTGADVYGVRISKSKLVELFMAWTQSSGTMTRESLGYLIYDYVPSLHERFAGSTVAERASYGNIVATHLINGFEGLSMIEKVGRRAPDRFQISGRGEQVRQFYVLKSGLSGSILDRADRFATA